jgi:hypothetical protein
MNLSDMTLFLHSTLTNKLPNKTFVCVISGLRKTHESCVHRVLLGVLGVYKRYSLYRINYLVYK